METTFHIFMVLWIILILTATFHSILKKIALKSSSNAHIVQIIRGYFPKEMNAHIREFVSKHTDKTIKSYLVYAITMMEIRYSNEYYNTFREWGTDTVNDKILDIISRIEKFVNDWTRNQYLSVDKLWFMWKSGEKFKYLNEYLNEKDDDANPEGAAD